MDTVDPGINDGTEVSARIVLSEDEISRNVPDLVACTSSLVTVIVTNTLLPGDGFSGVKTASNLTDNGSTLGAATDSFVMF